MTKRTDVIPEVTPEMSPMMRQYVDIKKQHPDSILFFRLGDFYEMFYNDAVVASDELDLTLTSRANGEENKAPMCGVPYHACETYIARLVSKGYRVAICEQTEDPSKTKKLVKRDITRVITPGTVTDESMLDIARNNYLAGIFTDENGAGICFCDISTGEVHITDIDKSNLQSGIINEITRFCPKEVLLNSATAALETVTKLIGERLGARIEIVDNEAFFDNACKCNVLSHFGVDSFSALGLPEYSCSEKALIVCFDFLKKTQCNDLSALMNVDYYSENQFMRLDISTKINLELVETLRSHDKKGSLIWVLDRAKTPMGKRLLRSWIELPLLSPAKITRRQNAVADLVGNIQIREELNMALREIKDLERLNAKVLAGTANARDLTALADTAEKLPYVKSLLNGMSSTFLKNVYNEIDELTDLKIFISNAICEEPALLLREGGLIREGFSDEVDSLRNDMNNGQGIVREIEQREQEKTGIKKLKIKYNRVFGYYIEVPNSAVSAIIPEEYQRRQTLANCERYITDEVKTLESRILGAKDKLYAVEFELFTQIRNKVSEYSDSIKRTAAAIARLDAIWSLAAVAAENGYVCPDIAVDGKIEIIEGRHPVVEKLSDIQFVPNDTILDMDSNRCAIITGPNMAGKSTYMRQIAVIVLMAQIGSFVPAKNAKIGIVDSIFTRVGASDDLATGQSTFMVEMTEVANILKYATSKSLLIIDEIGRGTSTYDGMAIARAVLEYIANRKKLGAKALFATHYHELTALEQILDGVKNYNIAAKKRGDDLIFLRRIVRGGADESYGIEVAKLAGVPNDIIKRARVLLNQLETDGLPQTATDSKQDEITLQSTLSVKLIKELQLIDTNALTPMQALQTLFELTNKAKNI